MGQNWMAQRRDPCGFLARGVTPAASVQVVFKAGIGGIGRRLRRLLTSSTPESTASPPNLSARHLLSFSFSHHFHDFISVFFVISLSFHTKNGSFPLIQFVTGAPLAPFPQISPKNHYKHDNRTDINQSSTYLTNEKRNCNI